MPNTPRPENPARSFRCEDELWNAAKAEAERRGETVTDVLIRALRRYTR